MANQGMHTLETLCVVSPVLTNWKNRDDFYFNKLEFLTNIKTIGTWDIS